jgi:prepilin-type N-terminal cleavage/methylation domain-containing protein
MYRLCLKNNKGFNLVEIIISVAIFSLMIGLVTSFQADIFSFNRIIQSGLQSQNDAKKIIKPFVNEVRGAIPSSLGAYSIKVATSTEFVFYNDTDSDGLVEEIRYYLEDGSFKKGIIKPSGNPLEYNEENEDVIKIVNHVINEDIFTFYDSSYDGSASSTSLTYPFNLTEIRLVEVELLIDDNVDSPPSAVNISTKASIRNLKDNR